VRALTNRRVGFLHGRLHHGVNYDEYTAVGATALSLMLRAEDR
jgi:hypothetical protein